VAHRHARRCRSSGCGDQCEGAETPTLSDRVVERAAVIAREECPASGTSCRCS
jgi:hypothetical protein